ncbi:MAG: aldo/keto reductase [Nitrospinota bacterium]
MAYPGYATSEGTEAYRKRFLDRLAPEHYRKVHGLWMSSIGVGTYLGDHDAPTDARYAESVALAVRSGCNVIDSAINYRFQRSERSVAAALRALFEAGEARREEVVVATKGGFIPFDGAPPRDAYELRSYMETQFFRPGTIRREEVAAGCHCMTPAYLANQLERSLRNLDLECVDIYYVHNPETQLQEVRREEFLSRLTEAFAFLEECVARGVIRMYGTATWEGYRRPSNARDYLSLAEVVGCARKAGGEEHHFKVVQLPLNLAMPEAFAFQNQSVDGEKVSFLEAAASFRVAAMASGSILQGQVARNLPAIVGEVFPGLETDAQRAIQFVRSTPGLGVALVGMKETAHVVENLWLATKPPADRDQYLKLFRRA